MPRPTGANHHAWNGGRKNNAAGYVEVLKPGHPMAKRNYVYEHRLVMAEHIGRHLRTDEHVHHVNGDKSDNRLENLELMSAGEHSTRHHLGMKYSDATRAVMKAYALNRTEEHKRRLSESQRGKPKSPEAIAKVAAANKIAQKNRWARMSPKERAELGAKISAGRRRKLAA